MKAADRCPGLLRPHLAEDGALIRLRLPGGQTTADTLNALSGLARRYGDPDLQLTSRAGIQLRGLTDPLPSEVVSAVHALGLIPSPRHERVRNIVASPLTGVTGGRADLRGLIHDLDRALVDEPLLAELPGRFLFVIDDGRGDVIGRSFDLGYQAVDAHTGHVLVGGAHLGFPVAAGRAVDVLIRLARDFTEARRASGAWHVREVPEWTATVDGLGPIETSTGAATAPLGDLAGAASVVVPLGLLTPRQADAIIRVAPGPVVVTPWRGVIIPGGGPGLSALTQAGLVVIDRSPWSLISACTGAPSCVQAVGSTRDMARLLVERGEITQRTHVSGCERRCGAPDEEHVDVLVGASPGATL